MAAYGAEQINEWDILSSNTITAKTHQSLVDLLNSSDANITSDLMLLNSITNKWTLAPLKPLRWPGYPSRLFYTDNAIAFAFPNCDAFTFQCGSNDSSAISFMHEFIDDTWVANIDSTA